jgi:hypothetical protein
MRAVTLAILLAAIPARADDEPRSSSTATWLSAGVTFGGAVVAVGSFATERPELVEPGVFGLLGFIVGPSVGHWYAGNFHDGPGGWMRYGGLALAGVGLFIASRECDALAGDDGNCRWREMPIGMTVIGVAGASYVAGMIWDIATAGDEARGYNRARGLTVAPLATPGASGLAISGRF